MHHRGSDENDEVPQDPLAIREPELFNTKEGKWHLLAGVAIDRLYHSNAILLPDEYVMAARSNPMRRVVNELRIEIFRPPYLYRGERPEIFGPPERISYGQTFEANTYSKNIAAVALIRTSSTTHCVNTE